MKRYFVDASHLIALVNPKDQWHAQAIQAANDLSACNLTTTEEVLTELLNFYSEAGPHMRGNTARFVRDLLVDMRVRILGRGETAFLEALDLYESRPDKGYSLTDCLSMKICRELGITEVLTSDTHFEQEGFAILLK